MKTYTKNSVIPVLTEETFNEWAKDDKKLHCMVYPKVLTMANGWPWDKNLTFSYPEEYEMTDEQVAKAKELAKQRHDEQLALLKPGVLAWMAMGGDYPTKEGGVSNHRIRCYFTNDIGAKYFIELHRINGSMVTDWVIDKDLEEIRQKERDDAWKAYETALEKYNQERAEIIATTSKEERKWKLAALAKPHAGDYQLRDQQDYYMFKYCHCTLDCEPTFDSVMDWINKHFNCSFHTSVLFNYFVNCDEYVCHSK